MPNELTKIDTKTNNSISLDKVDLKIIFLMLTQNENKRISTKLNIPLSTVRRRTKRIIKSGILHQRYEPDYKRFGIKKGLLHTYMKNGDVEGTAQKIAKMDGMLSTAIHVGNSDIVSDYIYTDSLVLMKTISSMRHIPTVDSVKWSEEVLSINVNPENALTSLTKQWQIDMDYLNNQNHKPNGNNNSNGNNNNSKHIKF